MAENRPKAPQKVVFDHRGGATVGQAATWLPVAEVTLPGLP